MKKYLKPRIEVTTVSTECQLLAGSGVSVSNQNFEIQPGKHSVARQKSLHHATLKMQK